METTEKNATVIEGTLKNYKANKHGDIDALEIDTNNGISKINFPPHTAKQIMDVAREGDKISISYEEKEHKHDPEGHKHPKLKLLTVSGPSGNTIQVSDIKPPKQHDESVPEKLQMEQFELLKGKKGELIGIRSGKTLVHIHKEDEALADEVKDNSKLEITAVKRTGEGFVNEDNDDVYHIRKITIDGKDYPTKK